MFDKHLKKSDISDEIIKNIMDEIGLFIKENQQ